MNKKSVHNSRFSRGEISRRVELVLPDSVFRMYEDEAARQSIALQRKVTVQDCVRAVVENYDANKVMMNFKQSAFIGEVSDLMGRYGLPILEDQVRRRKTRIRDLMKHLEITREAQEAIVSGEIQIPAAAV